MSKNPKKPAPNSSPQESSSEGKELSDRLEKLKTKLDGHDEAKAKWANNPDNPENKHARAGIGQALRLSSEFIAGVVVGAAIGYGVDALFGTSPWGLIIFLLLGFGAAVLNVMRAAGMVSESEMRLK